VQNQNLVQKIKLGDTKAHMNMLICKLMINNYETISVSVYWNDIGLPDLVRIFLDEMNC